MSQTPDTLHPPDICLLLRVDSEQRWLVSKVVPLLRQLEQQEIPEDELGPAIAYLEVLWLEAGLRAAETDTAARQLEEADFESSPALSQRAHRYHAAVRRLRVAVAARVRVLTCPSEDVHPAQETASP
jgi:hypothetical protein